MGLLPFLGGSASRKALSEHRMRIPCDNGRHDVQSCTALVFWCFGVGALRMREPNLCPGLVGLVA